VQPDGKILLGGLFTTVNGQTRNGIARLNADGTLESAATFNPGSGPNGYVSTMTLQANGKVLIGGNFTTVNGLPRGGIARLGANGTVESTATFDPGTGADTGVGSVALQADGRILLGGAFTTVNGTTRNKIARLVNDPAVQSLTAANSARVQWLRGGAAPEFERVIFEVSTDNGANWSPLGPGTRIPGGWERTGLNLPAGGRLRARGRFGRFLRHGRGGSTVHGDTVSGNSGGAAGRPHSGGWRDGGVRRSGRRSHRIADLDSEEYRLRPPYRIECNGGRPGCSAVHRDSAACVFCGRSGGQHLLHGTLPAFPAGCPDRSPAYR
jgi:hypothetical protein